MTFTDNILNYDNGIDDRNNAHRPQLLKKGKRKRTRNILHENTKANPRKKQNIMSNSTLPPARTPNVYMYTYMKS